MIEDLMSLGIFNDEELEVANDIETEFDIFKSWEYHAIYYITNNAMYYLPDEIQTSLEESADLVEETDKATIYMYK